MHYYTWPPAKYTKYTHAPRHVADRLGLVMIEKEENYIGIVLAFGVMSFTEDRDNNTI